MAKDRISRDVKVPTYHLFPRLLFVVFFPVFVSQPQNERKQEIVSKLEPFFKVKSYKQWGEIIRDGLRCDRAFHAFDDQSLKVFGKYIRRGEGGK